METLFNKYGPISTEYKRREGLMGPYVDSLTDNLFRDNEDSTIAEHVFQKFMGPSIQIDTDAVRRSPIKEDTIYVQNKGQPSQKILILDGRPQANVSAERGCIIDIYVPFSGGIGLLDYSPMSADRARPMIDRIESRDSMSGELVYSVKFLPDMPEDQLNQKINKEVEELLATLKHYAETLQSEAEQFNSNLKPKIDERIELRKARLAMLSRLTDNLEIPLKIDPNAPAMVPVKLRPPVALKSNPSTPNSTEPEYHLSEKDYELITNFIRHVGRTMEAAPETFSKFDEEELRDIILAFMNGQFEGEVTGETFRRTGKIDICLNYKNREAFIGEAKKWSGKGGVAPALDQMFSYMTWRDCKASLIVFNDSVKGFTDLLTKMEKELLGYPTYVKRLSIKEKGEWRIIYCAKDDPKRLITVHVFFFDILPSREIKPKLPSTETEGHGGN